MAVYPGGGCLEEQEVEKVQKGYSRETPTEVATWTRKHPGACRKSNSESPRSKWSGSRNRALVGFKGRKVFLCDTFVLDSYACLQGKLLARFNNDRQL